MIRRRRLLFLQQLLVIFSGSPMRVIHVWDKCYEYTLVLFGTEGVSSLLLQDKVKIKIFRH